MKTGRHYLTGFNWTNNFAGFETPAANVDPFGMIVDHCFDLLYVDIETTCSHPVRMADVPAGRWTFSANLALT